ncbi:MAG: chemotaxis protein CheX [Clostridia bacterium]|nr:chemotaxis protein CheX [Clostridia bacterium]
MDSRLQQPFQGSVKQILSQMAGIDVQKNGEVFEECDDIVSYGISSIIAFAGKIKGRLLLDMDQNLALKIAQNITGDVYPSVKEQMVMAVISELNNIISGDAITVLNNQFSLSLRLAPPIVFTGKDIIICIPKISSTSVNYETEFGHLKVNIAFEGRL